MAQPKTKLKVLCLHGYRQNEVIFRERSGAFRKLLKRHINFVFISAPHIIPEPDNLARPEGEAERGWWFSRPERRYNALDETDISTGFEESLKLVQEVFNSQGPFDGVLGFSQGAAFVSLLCSMQRDSASPIKFKFAILIAGFKSLVSPHTDMYKDLINCPSFHTIGATDAVIPTQSSEDLAASFTNATVYRHNGGHYVPASPNLRTAVEEFLIPFLSQ